jgi:7-cyano-7-deazaguanine synthase in queuosine biosynthesis
MNLYEQSFILKPTNTKYVIKDHFPDPNSFKNKIGVATSGGMESTLIAKIALEIYGEDRVVLIYSDNMFSANSKDLNENIEVNVKKLKKIFGIEPKYLDIDSSLHFRDIFSSVEKIYDDLSSKFNVDLTLWGFTKLFFDVAEFKEDLLATHDDVERRCFADPEKYYSVIEGFHLDTGLFTKYVKDLDIPDVVYKMIRHEDQNKKRLLRPLQILDKPEVVDLYKQLGIMEMVYETSSCITETVSKLGLHCGRCFNCQQRYDAFATLGLEDKTKYKSNFVEQARKEMEEAMRKRLANAD